MKTFYSVTYCNWGATGPSTEWFDNLEEAKVFADQDYHDNVVTHNLKDPEKISYVQERIDFRKKSEKLGL